MKAMLQCIGEAKKGAAGPIPGSRRSQVRASLVRSLREILRREPEFFC